MKKITVLIRVYNRLEDLEVCLDLIKKNWNKNEYEIIVVSNGKSKGYILNDDVKRKCDKVIELEENAGHLLGNSQLLKEGLKEINKDSEYVIILEADTWIFNDEIINKYVNKIKTEKLVWASAEWIKKYWSLALDIAIIDKNFLINNKEILNFSVHPECYICNYLKDKNFGFTYIKENMPVHRPNLIKKLYNAYGGRIREFPYSKMVTHHIEDLKNGIITKKSIANEIFGVKYFNIDERVEINNRNLKFIFFLLKICPNSSWIKKKKKKEF